MSPNEPDLWNLSKNVPITLINGEQLLDFPRPLPLSIAFIGEIEKRDKKKITLDQKIRAIVDSSDLGFVIFSFGTVCNTSSMPASMRVNISSYCFLLLRYLLNKTDIISIETVEGKSSLKIELVVH